MTSELPFPNPGVELIPGYTLVACLGSGGFGQVWKAQAPGGFDVALKLVPAGESAVHVEERTLDITRQLHHPNLIVTIGAWQVGTYVIIAMELARGTLLDRLREAVAEGHAGIPGPELLDYLEQAARGIDYLNEPRHTIGGKPGVAVQHRDIKPQNLLLVGNGVKVADFGLLQPLEHSMTQHSGKSLTMAYAPPEFFHGKTTATSDQYSLAVTYCQLRGGRLPFTGSDYQLMGGHLTEPPDLTMLPDAERSAVARALAKEPRERWPSCRAFVEALRTAGVAVPVAIPVAQPAAPAGVPAEAPPGPTPGGASFAGRATTPAGAAWASGEETVTRPSAAPLVAPTAPPAETLVPELLADLADRDPRKADEAAGDLARLGPLARPALPELRRLAEDRRLLVRRRAVHVLWAVDAPAVVEGLRDPKPHVRRAAGRIIGLNGPAAAATVPVLREMLGDADPRVRLRAAAALWHVERRPEAAVVAAALRDPSGGVRQEAAGLLRTFGRASRPAERDLLRALLDAKAGVRVRAAAALALWNAKAALPVLLESLDDPKIAIRRIAVASLGGITPVGRPALLGLIRAVDDKEVIVRRDAVAALARLGPAAREAVPALKRAFKADDVILRMRAGHALWRVDGRAEAALAALEPLLRGGNAYARSAGARLLGDMGPDAAPAAAALREALRDREWMVSRAAAIALRKIQSPDSSLAGH